MNKMKYLGISFLEKFLHCDIQRSNCILFFIKKTRGEGELNDKEMSNIRRYLFF